MNDLYRMFDAAPTGMFQVDKDSARDWNEKGWGIFWTVNQFNGARRKENLHRIVAWAIDMDDGSKQEQHDKLQASPLVPSLIVETRRGYQAYWLATACRKDGPPKAEHWNALVLERLVPHFGSDKNARDLCRVLRVPGYKHMKDPSSPFNVRVVWKHHVGYTERQIADAFKWVPDRSMHDQALRDAQRDAREKARRDAIANGAEPTESLLGSVADFFGRAVMPTESLWDAVWSLDCEDGLQRLSGHWAVGGETYTFRRTGRGNLNLFVNGKSSSCFIDENKRIGSLAGGGPTLVQWLRWYQHPWRTVLDVLFEIYPHLRDIDEAAKGKS